jgi:tRNA(Ile2) C34 agmatinyltransferase TiaS
MPTKQQQIQIRKKALKATKNRQRQKQTRYSNLLARIRGFCATCGKMMILAGRKNYICPDHEKHLNQKAKETEG